METTSSPFVLRNVYEEWNQRQVVRVKKKKRAVIPVAVAAKKDEQPGKNLVCLQVGFPTDPAKLHPEAEIRVSTCIQPESAFGDGRCGDYNSFTSTQTIVIERCLHVKALDSTQMEESQAENPTEEAWTPSMFNERLVAATSATNQQLTSPHDQEEMDALWFLDAAFPQRFFSVMEDTLLGVVFPTKHLGHLIWSYIVPRGWIIYQHKLYHPKQRSLSTPVIYFNASLIGDKCKCGGKCNRSGDEVVPFFLNGRFFLSGR